MDKTKAPPPPPSYDSLGLPGQPQQTSYGFGVPQPDSRGLTRQPQQTPYGFGAPQPAMQMQPTPTEAQWMSRPHGPIGCPPGLQYLCQVNQLNLQQEVEVSRRGIAISNWYWIMNGSGQQMYTAIEDPPRMDGLCVCLPGQRGYTVNIRDNLGHVVMRVVRDPLCCSCCPCLGFEHVVQIEAPVGRIIGYFKSLKNICNMSFTISNPEDEVIFTMRLPYCSTQLYLHWQEFFINSKDGSREVARITKHWERTELPHRLKKYKLSCIAISNWYWIMNGSGQQMYTAIEDPPRMDGLCVCLPGQRGYTVNIRDNLGHVVMRVVRDPLCCSCCPCLGFEHVVQIEAPVGRIIGYFKSLKNICNMSFTISNPEDEVIFTMRLPYCSTQLYLHWQEFFINSKDGSREVARITKHWERTELPHRLKKYKLSFPSNLDEKMKAVFLGTLFAIDVMYYPPLEGQVDAD